jgi:hypothetical protein
VVKTEDDRRWIEEAILAVSRRMEDEEKRAMLLTDALKGNDEEFKASLLYVLGELPSNRSLKVLMEALESDEEKPMTKAIHALSKWPDPVPLSTLLHMASAAPKGGLKDAAFAGALHLAGLPHSRTLDENKGIYEQALQCADTKEKRIRVIESVSRITELWAVNFLTPFMDDPDTAVPAKKGIYSISSHLARMVSHDGMTGEVTLGFPYTDKYSGGGKNALIDGKWGSTKYGDGRWQGFNGYDLDAIIDLGQEIPIRSIRAGFLKDVKSWIFLPLEVVFFLSKDKETFQEVKTFTLPVPAEEGKTSLQDFYFEADLQVARYVRVKAKNVGLCPDWHPGSGGKAWLFADEIQINPHFDTE